MLQRAIKPEADKQSIKDFKKGAELSPTSEVPENTRRITHTIQYENWEFLRQLSTVKTKVAGHKVTINSLLDEAVELLKEKYRER